MLLLGAPAIVRGDDDPGATAERQEKGLPRLPPRPQESADVRAERIAGLRRVYQGPPAEWPKPDVDPGVEWVELGILPPVPHPATNPPTAAKVALGKMLFFDPMLSGSGQIACASCHDPDLGWADGRTTSFGHDRQALRRNSPGLLNIGQARSLFWDGRAATLEDQARAVILNPHEMNAPAEATVAAVAKVPGYRPAFREAFGADDVTLDTVALALAAFERTLVGGRSKFDAFLKGNPQALTDEAIAGLDLFRGAARCLNCHNGPAFSDGQFHDLGLSYYGRELEDLGRYRITRDAADVGRFRTPSLRNVGNTKPYMHNGVFELDGVLRMYNAGMATLRRPSGAPKPDAAPFPTKSPRLRPLGLNDRDLADLKAFLESLNEPRGFRRPPILPPSPPELIQNLNRNLTPPPGPQ
ncbi:cytochrome-c peroxidase [Singulisphaera sp. GP187]|uniref:cytochrome-c peroxidase n=1 Tax=Singulisphaera sp. GP187 TaxID=1882752 RepID=UPI0020B104F9|nr:cytochrome c peroxidase [Singulisphaera sp. GP187]